MLASLPEHAFDAAVFYCTLERLPDPDGCSEDLKRGLGPGGVVMVIAPTIDSRTARLFRSAWWEFNRRNLHYFSADTLQSLLLKSGFGDPIIDGDDSAVSLEYFRAKIPAVSSAFLPAQPEASRVGDAGLPAAPRVPLAEQPTGVPRPLQAGRGCADAVGDRSGLQRAGDVFAAHGPPDCQIDRRAWTSRSCWSRATPRTARARRPSATAAHPRVRLILQDRPRGKGHAVRAGLAACTGDVVLFQDADLEYDIDDYDDLIAPLLAYRRNFVIGSRHVSKGRVWKIRQFNDAAPLAAFFNLGHVFFLGLFNFIYRQRLRDPFSMFKVFRRECLYGLSFECNRFDFDFEIVIKLLRKGYRPLELPVNYRARSPSEGKKVSMVRDPLTWMRALLKFRWGPLYRDTAVTSERVPRDLGPRALSSEATARQIR